MAKERKTFIEHTVFDTAAYAQDVYQASQEKLDKNMKGIKLGLICSALMLVAYLLCNINSDSDFLFTLIFGCILVGLVFAVLSIFSGGVSGAAVIAKLSWKIASIGWWIIPFFPWDLFAFVFVLVFALCGVFLALCCAPWILQLLARIQLTADRNDAEEYLKYCKPMEN